MIPTTNATESTMNQGEQQQHLFTDVIGTSAYEKTMKNARIWLYVIAGFQAVLAFIEYSRVSDPTEAMLVLGIDFAIGLLFLGLAVYSKENPVTAFTTALIMYVLIVVGLSILEPSNAYKGIIMKIFIIIALVKANKDARKYVEIKESMGEEPKVF